MSTLTNSTHHENQQTHNHDDPLISRVTGLIDNLNDALVDSLDRQDSKQIIQGIAAAICVQELTRMTVTRIKMDAGIRSTIDPECVCTDWQALCRHYAGTKYANILDHGVSQLEKLNSEQAREIIFAIRRSMESSLNWAMEEKAVKIGLSLPIVGKLGIGNLYFNLRGTRVAMRSLAGRCIRLVVQGALWLSVLAGAIHWIVWTFFQEPYLALTYSSLAKLTQFLLVTSATLVVWALARAKRDDATIGHGRMFSAARFFAWAIVIAGWSHFLAWLLFGISIEAGGVEPVTKLLLPFFIVCGAIAAWISGRVFRGDGVDDEKRRVPAP